MRRITRNQFLVQGRLQLTLELLLAGFRTLEAAVDLLNQVLHLLLKFVNPEAVSANLLDLALKSLDILAARLNLVLQARIRAW